MSKKKSKKRPNATALDYYRLRTQFMPVAEPGWRVLRAPWAGAVKVESEDELEVFPLAGWVIELERVMPAIWLQDDPSTDSGDLLAVDTNDQVWLWLVFGPGQNIPTVEEMNREIYSMPSSESADAA